MKKNVTIFVLTAFVLLFAADVQAQIQGAGTKLRWFRTNTTCPGTYDHAWDGVVDSPVAFQDISLSGLTCLNQGATDVRASGWSTAATVDPATDPHIAFAMTPNPGYTINFDGSFDRVRLKNAFRGSNGPTSCQFYSRTGIDEFAPMGDSFSLTTTTTTYNVTPAAFSVAEGVELQMALFCWSAALNTAHVRFEEIVLLFDEVLPVELVAFEATADGADVALQWETASELNNAGFFVEMAPRTGEAFEQLGFVDGNGTTELPQRYRYRISDLDPGSYTFRLKQIDYDGTFEYHPEVEVVIGMVESYVMDPVFPNPFNPQAAFRFAVSREQHVEVGLFDMLGREVQRLYTGRPTTGQMQEISIDGGSLPSGLYLVRVVGETFVQTQKVTLIK